MLQRHTRPAIFLHWFNAACWLILLFSGLALFAEHLQPASWNRDFWHGLLGPRGLLYFHVGVGCVWIVTYCISALLFGKTVFVPFAKRICEFKPGHDLAWCLKKSLWLTLGPSLMKQVGISPDLPPQGFYNAGQRFVAVIAILCALGLMATGVMLTFFSGSAFYALSENSLQWAILLHFCFAATMALFLPIHIYMAAFAPGEGPALRSMFTGKVPKEYARHHNPLWHEEMCGSKTKVSE